MVDTPTTPPTDEEKVTDTPAPTDNTAKVDDAEKAETDKPTETAPENQDKQDEGLEGASKKPGEALGAKKSEQKAAETKPADVKPGKTSKKTNPVGRATEIESKDPYAEGKHIANPEPNNGNGPDKDSSDQQETSDRSAQTVADQEKLDASK